MDAAALSATDRFRRVEARVDIDGEIDGEMLVAVRRQLVAIGPDRPLFVHVDSAGGDVSSAIGIAEWIAGRPGPTHCHGVHVSSAALLPFAAGRERSLAPAAVVHPHRAAVEDFTGRLTAPAMARCLATVQVADRKMAALLSEWLGQPPAAIAELLDLDRALLTSEIRKFGIIT